MAPLVRAGSILLVSPRAAGNGIQARPLRVLVAGAGVAALEAALALRRLAEERVEVELMAPESHFWYRPLAVVEPFEAGRLHGVELAALAEACGAVFTLGSLAAVDPIEHVGRTAAGAEIGYDALLVAAGAKPVEAVQGSITFRGPADTDALRDLLSELEAGSIRHVAFALPAGVGWPLPLYELALQTAVHLERRGAAEGAQLSVVTHEAAPLEVFGAEASSAVTALLRERGIGLHTGRYAVAAREGSLSLVPPPDLAVDRVVSLPRLVGVPIPGLPHDADGFLPTDLYGRVSGVDDVYAAGDATAFPVKQGGLAAQQADVAAQTIAAAAGAPVEPEPFRPVLRGLILTGGARTFVRADLRGGSGETSLADTEPLWWPPGKIAGRYLAPFLAERAGLIFEAPSGGLQVEVDLPLPSPG
jgi:sulfide:quinone oxidoreductase